MSDPTLESEISANGFRLQGVEEEGKGEATNKTL